MKASQHQNALPAAASGSLMVGACNTAEGLGEDVEGAGESIQETAEDVEDEL